MVFRRLIGAMAVALLVMAACISVRAAESKFSLSVQADGVSLGTAAATLTVDAAGPGEVTWKLKDGSFTALPNPDGKLKWADDILTGSGKVKATSTTTLKDFDITVQQSTGVDVTYRFRLSATLSEGAVKSVTIEQVS